mgnify:CR=1 FL=1
MVLLRQEILDASHYLHHDRPDVVVRAVREVVAAVRGPASGDSVRNPAGVHPAEAESESIP